MLLPKPFYKHVFPVPLEGAAAMWFTPRIALLPYSGTIWPLSDGWLHSPTGLEITIGLALLNLLYVGLALVAAAHRRENLGIAVIVVAKSSLGFQ